MDLKTTEKKIRETEAAISRDAKEITRIEGTIQRSQDRKKFLENRVRESEEDLSNLKNRRAVLLIEEEIGAMDESKLDMLRDFLGKHGDAFEPAAEKGDTDDEQGEAGRPADVGE